MSVCVCICYVCVLERLNDISEVCSEVQHLCTDNRSHF